MHTIRTGIVDGYALCGSDGGYGGWDDENNHIKAVISNESNEREIS
jgi:hypothetical protein